MLKSFISFCLVGILATLMVSPLQAKDHRFRLSLVGVVDGVQLKPGLYTLKLESEGNPQPRAKIFRNGKLLAEAPVQVRPRANETSNTAMQSADGSLREIRLKKQVIVFTTP